MRRDGLARSTWPGSDSDGSSTPAAACVPTSPRSRTTSLVGTDAPPSENVQSGPGSVRSAADRAPDRSLGTTVTLSNGRVVPNPLATQLRFAYPTRADRQFTLGALHLLNLRVGRGFSVGAQRLELAVDVLNVTNHGADQWFLDGANQLESPTFGKGANRQFPGPRSERDLRS